MKKYIMQIFLLFISGCGPSSNSDFIPMLSPTVQSTETALRSAKNIFEKNGYIVSVNESLLQIITIPYNLGYQIYFGKNEKWDITISFEFLIIETKDKNYWKLSNEIEGKRSGNPNRLFRETDFELTKMKYDDIYRQLMNAISSGI
jgi:hypothetical protein